MEDKAAGLNGFKIRSYGDLAAFAALVSMFMGVVAWGLKLESELNTLRESYGSRLANIEARVADGILPRAEERIAVHSQRIDALSRRMERVESRD